MTHIHQQGKDLDQGDRVNFASLSQDPHVDSGDDLDQCLPGGENINTGGHVPDPYLHEGDDQDQEVQGEEELDQDLQ